MKSVGLCRKCIKLAENMCVGTHKFLKMHSGNISVDSNSNSHTQKPNDRKVNVIAVHCAHSGGSDDISLRDCENRAMSSD